MKICPKCARSFADGFAYCPNDATALVKYDLRTHIQSKPELQFLLKNQSLLTRLWCELRSAWDELRNNPRSYLAGLLRGEGSNRRRRRLLQAGVATAVISYTAIALLVILFGLITSPTSQRVVTAEPEPIPPDASFRLIFTRPKEQAKNEIGSNLGRLGGSLKQPQSPHGGGGQRDNAPARGGAPPQTAPIQLLKPNLDLPKVDPVLPTVMTIVVDPASLLKKMTAPPGLIGSSSNNQSLGNGDGTGIGSGRGPGYGPGYDGNFGGGPNKTGGGETDGVGKEPLRMSSRLRPTILYKEKAVYTEEARQNRVQGDVVLNVTFGADSRIHDVRVQKGLPSGLTEKAIEAVRRIKFQPAIQNGRPVSVRGTVEFNFALY